MQRDMDVIRTIVLAVRQSDKPMSALPGIDPILFATHVELLDEAGLIRAILQPDNLGNARAAIIMRLTWAGHDFADSILDDTIWRKAKETILKPAASWSFGVLLEFLKLEIKHRVGME